MSTDRPDDRADEQAAIRAAARVITMALQGRKWADATPLMFADALSDAGLLATPADQDNAADQVTANAVCHLLGERLRRAEAERDLLRAQVAAVRKIHERRTDGGDDEWCVEESADWPCATIQKLDTAGGGQP